MGKLSASPLVVLCTLLVSVYLLSRPAMVRADKFGENMKPADNSENPNGIGGGNGMNRRNLRSLYGFGPRMLQVSRSKIPMEFDLLVENDELGEKVKRFDDYGHLRFGKRGGEEQFDDYGHMRFGRSASV